MVARKTPKLPHGSEIPIREWLHQIGAVNIQYCGNADGPPDFVVGFRDEEIAIEATLLHDPKGWGKTREIAFERQLSRLIKEVALKDANAPRWHVICEYDPAERYPPRPNRRQWKDAIRMALRTKGPGQTLQLLSSEEKRGRGVTLHLIPASNDGSLSPVSVDEGFMVMPTLTERTLACITHKTKKQHYGSRSHRYDRWWLVLDDEIFMAPMASLARQEICQIETLVRQLDDKAAWSKIVLVTRFQPTLRTGKLPMSFHPLWQDPRHPALPPL